MSRLSIVFSLFGVKMKWHKIGKKLAEFRRWQTGFYGLYYNRTHRGEHSVQARPHTYLVNRKETIMEKQSHVISVFKKKELTKEDYTKIWIELISVLERKKSVNFPLSQWQIGVLYGIIEAEENSLFLSERR